MPTLEENIKRLDEISNLPENWNGYGVSSFSKQHIEKAKKLAKDLEEFNPYVFPTANDSIQFEAETDIQYMEWNIFPDGKIERFVTYR